MTKISIVGVRGSGKTVLLAALGNKYERPDEDGLFFRAKDSATFAFVRKTMAELRAGRWPLATSLDQMQDVNWVVMRRRAGTAPVPVGAVSMLDFAGEIYATAFGDADGSGQGNLSDEVARLKEYVAASDVLVVLVNIADLCNAPDETDEDLLRALWASMAILDFAAEKGVRRVAIGLSQFDRFCDLAEACGGPLKTLDRYAPFLYSAYGHLPLFTLTAVDQTVPDAEGRALPARGFGSQGLEALVAWMLDRAKPTPAPTEAASLYRVIDLGTGTVTHLDAVPLGGWTAEHKTAKLALRRIDKGTFTMGSPSDEEDRNDNETQHRVTLTKPFYIGVFAVTQAQWERVMGTNPSWFKGASRPVEKVSWEECREFCEKVGLGLRLPTEAEWEYACRAGTTTAYFWGNALNGDRASCNGNHPCGTTAKGPYKEKTCAVGSYAPNAWGLYDMHGNVYEWCADWYWMYGGDATDPTGPASGVDRVCRGGGWSDDAGRCRSARRLYFSPGFRFNTLGFRLACSAGPSE